MKRARLRSLDDFYVVPDEYDTLEAWERRHHLDLDGQPREWLCLERTRLRFRLSFDPSPDDWLLDRLQHLDAALGRAPR